MTDIQFVDARHCRHRGRVVVVQAMPGIHHQPACGIVNGVTDALEFAGRLFCIDGLRVSTGMDLDHGRPRPDGRIDLHRIGIDEQRHLHALAVQPATGSRHLVEVPRHIKTTLGGQFFPLLRHQANMRRPYRLGKSQHFLGHCHLEIHACLQHLGDEAHITLLNVPTVFAQMQRDAIGTRFLGNDCRLYRIRIAGTACLTQRRHVINVDTQQDGRAHDIPLAPGFCNDIRDAPRAISARQETARDS